MSGRRTHEPTFTKNVTHVFRDVCEKSGLTIVAVAIDRFGSLEWSAYHRDTLNRYIALDITNVSAETRRNHYQIEFWYIVDDEQHFLRRQLGLARRVGVEEIQSGSIDLAVGLTGLWEAARRVEPAELTQPVLMPVYGARIGS